MIRYLVVFVVLGLVMATGCSSKGSNGSGGDAGGTTCSVSCDQGCCQGFSCIPVGADCFSDDAANTTACTGTTCEACGQPGQACCEASFCNSGCCYSDGS